MYSISDDTLIPLFNTYNGNKEPYNECRQKLPDTFLHNGYIDNLNRNILDENTISGYRIYPYVMKNTDVHDIDTEEDWKKAESVSMSSESLFT